MRRRPATRRPVVPAKPPASPAVDATQTLSAAARRSGDLAHERFNWRAPLIQTSSPG
jgi:hypothetical protein